MDRMGDQFRGRSTREHNQRVALAFGMVLQAARERRALSPEQLADRGGFDRTYPRSLEHGVREPTLGDLLRLSVGVGATPSRLLEETVFVCTQQTVAQTDVLRRRRAIWIAFATTLARHHKDEPMLSTVLGQRLLDELSLNGLAIVSVPMQAREGCGNA